MVDPRFSASVRFHEISSPDPMRGLLATSRTGMESKQTRSVPNRQMHQNGTNFQTVTSSESLNGAEFVGLEGKLSSAYCMRRIPSRCA